MHLLIYPHSLAGSHCYQPHVTEVENADQDSQDFDKGDPAREWQSKNSLLHFTFLKLYRQNTPPKEA